MEDDLPHEKPKTRIGDVATISCERCRRRKIKCDKQQPCAGCKKAGTHCIIAGAGEKQRPVPKSYVTALEGHAASLELFIQRLAGADHARRDELLSGYVGKPGRHGDLAAATTAREAGKPEVAAATTDPDLVLARARAGQLRKLRVGNAKQFFGGTSLFQIHAPDEQPGLGSTVSVEAGAASVNPDQLPATVDSPLNQVDLESISLGIFPYSPHHELCQQLMADFFETNAQQKLQYPFVMWLYREFFLRDYDTGAGPYYSDLLLYAICAMGALAKGEPSMVPVSEIFAYQAESLVYASLDQPDLPLMQALILLGYRYIGHGKASRGWLFCGMAFRLAHEMGLHLDPNNWSGPSEPHIEQEISRRAYWAAFNADKHLSLYFGRPPALYPHESDVRNAIRIPYPEGWQGLLETYLAQDVSATAYEDGIALAGSFIYRVELMKIAHNMITDVFENRRHNADGSVLAATSHRIHVSLTKWLSSLPGKLHWNQWSNGQIQPFVLHLHMLFHTVMIILHRPPRHLFRTPGIAASDDVEYCYESLQALLKLLRSYARFYRFSSLPLDFVHTLSVAAGTILMKRSLEAADPLATAAGHGHGGGGSDSKAMDTVLDAMHEIRHTWPCVVEIRESVLRALEGTDKRGGEMSGVECGTGVGTGEEASARPTPEVGRDPILDFGFLPSMVGAGGALPAEPGGLLDFQMLLPDDADLNAMMMPHEGPAHVDLDLAAQLSWGASSAHHGIPDLGGSS